MNYTVGTSPVALVSGTFNTKNNGNLDLAVVNQGSNSVSMLLGNGDGTFAPKQDFAVGNTPTAITSADFNNDGNADLAVTNRADNDFSVLRGNGDGTFGAQTDFTTGNGPSAIASADFNVDGNQDVAVTNSTDNTVVDYSWQGRRHVWFDEHRRDRERTGGAGRGGFQSRRHARRGGGQ